MARFRIHRMKEAPRQHFRWAPHVSGAVQVKPKDYETDTEIDALHEYEAWANLQQQSQPLKIGDLLENESGELKICKYVGWDTAVWLVPDLSASSPISQPEKA